jgi:hypothetical protein
MNRIIYPTPEGGVAVIIPAESTKKPLLLNSNNQEIK